jgi:hypothetical protein
VVSGQWSVVSGQRLAINYYFATQKYIDTHYRAYQWSEKLTAGLSKKGNKL